MEQPLGFEIFEASDGEPGIRPVYKEVVVRPWGTYETIYIGSGFLSKTIVVNPGHRLSNQRHRWRDEHWFVVEGEAVLTANNQTVKLYRGMSADIERGVWHRVQNKQQIPLVFIEVQTGDCFEEDIERREDDYGRVLQ
jgi:mannose-6-phosphate isomerase